MSTIEPMVRSDWLTLVPEAALEPDLPIVDCHHHFWDIDSVHYLEQELVQDLLVGHNVVATLFVECASMYRADGDPSLRPVGETEFVVATAKRARELLPAHVRPAAGIIGAADLGLGRRVNEVFDAHILAGEGRFRGIRQTTTWDADPMFINRFTPTRPDMLLEPAFREGFACLAPRGLVFDSWAYHTQLPQLCQLVGSFPETTVVVDHVGGPLFSGPYSGRNAEIFAVWRDSMAQLARYDNVRVKIGGMGMKIFDFALQDRARPIGSAELAELLRPFVETCIDLFGPRRCMFESNFPVDKRSYSYGVLWNAFKIITKEYSANERSYLFDKTARLTYNI